MQKAKGGIDNQSLITGFSITTSCRQNGGWRYRLLCKNNRRSALDRRFNRL